jgi:hypothetical protein
LSTGASTAADVHTSMPTASPTEYLWGVI